MATTLAGFAEAKKQPQPVKRLIISVEGRERTGKTTFGLSAPGPIAFFPIDPGREGVLDKAIKGKKIYLPLDKNGEIETFDFKDSTDRDEYIRLWEKYKTFHLNALASKEVKTIVWDTASEAWELIRLARFGKLTQVMPMQYGPVNTEFRDLVKKVYKTDKNLILLHKVKKEYVDEKFTGDYERAGFSEIGYLVQINLRLSWDEEEGFSMVIKDCRQDMGLAGTILKEPMNCFSFLAANVYPDTSPEDWD